jgi:hypothetical protein
VPGARRVLPVFHDGFCAEPCPLTNRGNPYKLSDNRPDN